MMQHQPETHPELRRRKARLDDTVDKGAGTVIQARATALRIAQRLTEISRKHKAFLEGPGAPDAGDVLWVSILLVVVYALDFVLLKPFVDALAGSTKTAELVVLIVPLSVELAEAAVGHELRRSWSEMREERAHPTEVLLWTTLAALPIVGMSSLAVGMGLNSPANGTVLAIATVAFTILAHGALVLTARSPLLVLRWLVATRAVSGAGRNAEQAQGDTERSLHTFMTAYGSNIRWHEQHGLQPGPFMPQTTALLNEMHQPDGPPPAPLEDREPAPPPQGGGAGEGPGAPIHAPEPPVRQYEYDRPVMNHREDRALGPEPVDPEREAEVRL